MEEKKILIVDDEADERRLIKLLLKTFDFEFIEASDGEEAVKLASTVDPSLIIMDHRMPKLTGYEAIKRIQMNEKLRNIPIIMMTAQRFDSQMKEMIKMDVVEYIPKPFDRVFFLNLIKKILDVEYKEGKKKVLLSTESIEVRAVIKTQLGEKYEIVEIKTINELVEKIDKISPSLIVSNIKFLDWTSNESKKLLSQIVSSRIPLIVEIFTAQQGTLEVSALKTPELFYIQPFAVDDLREFVEKLSR